MLDEDRLIFETQYWRVLVADFDQRYLGRCVIVLKRPCGDLADITSEEHLDFLEIVKKLKAAGRKAFHATMFNWGCLMNNAYQKDPPDPHVHWHFRPRYKEPVQFAGKVFEDKEFGYHYFRDAHTNDYLPVPPDVALQIRDALRNNL